MAHGYTDEDWEGKARMARARQGVKTIERGRLLDVVETSQTTSKPIYEQVLVDATPDPLDEEALRRAR